MHLEKKQRALFGIILLISTSLAAAAQQPPGSNEKGSGEQATPVASPPAAANLLPDKLAGIKATADIKQFTRDTVAGLVGDKAPIYQEYRVISAGSREYSGARIDVFETQNQFAALGLFMFNSAASGVKSVEERDLGTDGVRLTNGQLIFCKGKFFVRVGDASQTSHASSGIRENLARALSEAIASNPVSRPPLLDSLPAASLVPQSQQYFLGAESLNSSVEHGREMFEFAGDTEAVMARYSQAEAPSAGDSQAQTTTQASGKGSALRDVSLPIDSTLTLLIVECHTPQFATDAMERVTAYVGSLPETAQQQIIVKRTGNYVIEALNVRNREFAEELINSVQYPYTVKWLRNPLWPANDPFRMEKTANMLLSTFGLLGLILLTVLGVGSVFGTTIFLRRRKQQREVFSDAGGMLRLEIDPFESVLLGLPPKRDN